MKTIQTKQKQEKQIKESLDTVNIWKGKFHFSFATLLFSMFLLVFYLQNQFFGFIPTVVLSIATLVLIQQTIRSYNYFKFHRVTYRSLKMLHEIFDEKYTK